VEAALFAPGQRAREFCAAGSDLAESSGAPIQHADAGIGRAGEALPMTSGMALLKVT